MTANGCALTAPDALNNLKRAFKGMFKRSKKNKNDPQPPTSSYGTAASGTASSQIPPPTASSQAPPQLPPIQNASSPFHSTNNSATETLKPLPPTHPLATGPQQQPSVAIPPSQDAQPGMPAPVISTTGASTPAAATTTNDAEGINDEQLAPGRVSPAEQGSTFDGARSGAVSAVDESSQAEEPVKTDSGIEQPRTDGAEEEREIKGMLLQR